MLQFAYWRMPFSLCNAHATFQRCMIVICSHMLEKNIELFIDDFSTFGKSFDHCLYHLDDILKRCSETNLVLGHKIFGKDIQADQAKIEVIEKLPPPIYVKGVRSFWGTSVSIRRFFLESFSIIKKKIGHCIGNHCTQLGHSI